MKYIDLYDLKKYEIGNIYVKYFFPQTLRKF